MFTIVRGLAQFLHYTIFYWGIEYPNVSVCTCMFMAKQLCNYAPIKAIITNCDCLSPIDALWHSMPMFSVCNKLNWPDWKRWWHHEHNNQRGDWWAWPLWRNC